MRRRISRRYSSNGGVRLLPSLLLDKNQSGSFTPSEVFLFSLKEFSPDDKVHCPVWALKWYLELTKPLRGGEKALFIRSREPFTKASKSTVAGWVKEAIAGAFPHLPKERRERMGIRAHDTRGVATTWATMAGVPFEAIMDAAAWSRPQTFAQFYLKVLPATKGRFMKMQGSGLKLYISRPYPPPPLLPHPRTSAPRKQQLDFFL